MENTIQFSGLIPQHYQDLLTPFLFDGFSKDLMKRIDFSNAYNVLELASGTGSTTKQLLKHLPVGAHLNATDLQSDMLEVAKQQVSGPNVSWNVVDMSAIPDIDGQYDLIICQFGLMLVPDKLKAIGEMFRVLKKGGKVVFSVWADINDNPVWKITGNIIEGFLGANPILQNPGPFSLSDKHETLDMLEKVSFQNAKATIVYQTGAIESSAMATKGMVQGLPVFMAISKRGPSLIARIEEALEPALAAALGNFPLNTPLSAWIFEATK
jgi:ubiquinone/menaquinone biosynthesis C-methylase UbiE